MGLSGNFFEPAAESAASQLTRSIPAISRNVAIVGFGTVGRAVAKILSDGRAENVRLTHVLNRDVERKRVEWAGPDVTWTDSFDDVIESDVDVVVELIGGLHPAKEFVTGALKAGKSVVTANKQLIAAYGPELINLARSKGQRLAFGASVCGGMPVLPALESGLCGDEIVEISGILNGTCNYILTKIESDSVSFEDALTGARELGYAEADPTDDIEGYDARAKLVVLTRAALRCDVSGDDIQCRGISGVQPIDFVYAKKIGCTIRQVSYAKAEKSHVTAWVGPALVPLATAMADVQGSRNVLITRGVVGGENIFTGYGAGGDPTAVAVVSDLLTVVKHRRAPAVEPVLLRSTPVAPDFEAPHFVRLVIQDRPGLLAVLASAFSRHGINIEAVLQEPGFKKSWVPFVMTLDTCRSSQLEKAVEDISNLDFLVEKPVPLPILR